MWCGVAQWLARQTVDVKSWVRFSPGDVDFQSWVQFSPRHPPPPAVQEQELPLSEVGSGPGWQLRWILYYKICIKSRKKYLFFFVSWKDRKTAVFLERCRPCLWPLARISPEPIILISSVDEMFPFISVFRFFSLLPPLKNVPGFFLTRCISAYP